MVKPIHVLLLDQDEQVVCLGDERFVDGNLGVLVSYLDSPENCPIVRVHD